jgi:hypothetical protein
MTFIEATDALIRRPTTSDLARLFDCSVSSIHQARMKPQSPSHRAPPPDWEVFAAAIAQDQATYFTSLANTLARHIRERTPRERQSAELRRRLTRRGNKP